MNKRVRLDQITGEGKIVRLEGNRENKNKMIRLGGDRVYK